VARTKAVVVDASVAVKWFVDEPGSDAANRLLDDYVEGRIDVHSTQQLPFEVLNALRYNPEFGLEKLKTTAKAIEALSLALHPLQGDYAERTLANAVNHGVTVYDSGYVSLGEELGLLVYTADEKLIKKVGTKSLLHISRYGVAASTTS
jgi:predicted nucleic acid-binding protein